MTVSAHYRKIQPEDVESVARTLADAWMSPTLPAEQWESVVKEELVSFARRRAVAPYDTLREILKPIMNFSGNETRLLDVGASSGYYREVLKMIGFKCNYTALDFSTYYKDLAEKLYPGIQFEVASADSLPFENKSFDVVLHGACIMHLPLTYEVGISEAARVTKEYVILHRTPIYTDDTPTEFFMKTAYGVPCIETHFNETELLTLFHKHRLYPEATADVFMDGNFGHRSYLLRVV